MEKMDKIDDLTKKKKVNNTTGDRTLDQPVKELKDKWRLVPSYLKIRGLVKHQIDSFNAFVEHELRRLIVCNSSHIVSAADPNFFLKYIDVKVASPCIEESFAITRPTTPHECRLRDLTYAAPITVDIEYTRGQQRIIRKDLCIGHLPIMLRSAKCALASVAASPGTSAYEMAMAKMNECAYDPGGYFVCRGQEKVILMQEQMSSNRMIVERDRLGLLMCHVQSSTGATNTRTGIVVKNGQYLLRNNMFDKDVPIVTVFKAMDITSDQEIVQMVGTDETVMTEFTPSLATSHKLGIFTREQALKFLGTKLKAKRYVVSDPLTPAEEVDVYDYAD